MKETVDQICAQLTEGNRAAVRRVVTAIGAEQSLALLAQTLELEAKGGLLTTTGQRRRTPGGVFFQLARAVVPKDQYKHVFPSTYHQRRAKRRREQAKQRNARTEASHQDPTERQDSPAPDTVAPLTISGRSRPLKKQPKHPSSRP